MLATNANHAVLTRRTLFVGTGTLLVASAARASARTADWGAVDAAAVALIDKRIAPGLSLTITRNGRVVHEKGYGFANLETVTPMTPDCVFRIGSITKQFTGAAFALLQQDGKLSVDDRLAKYLPEVPRAAEITLRQMLKHTSGLGNYTKKDPRTAFLRLARVDYDSGAILEEMLEHTIPLYAHEPGTAYDYSNTAYVLLGLVIDQVAGEPWPRFYKRRLFDAAGLASTTVDDGADVVAHRVSGYTGHPDDPAKWDNAPFISMTYPGAAGNIRSTSGDLCKWHTALLAGHVVSPDALKLMTTPGLLKDGSIPTQPGTAGPDPVRYGFGFAMDSFEGHASIQHSGGIFGFTSHIRSFPAEGVTVVMLANTDGGGRSDDPASSKALAGVRNAAAQAALSG